MVEIRNVTFTGNAAGKGGGAYLKGGKVHINQVLFHNNSAIQTGGGVTSDTGVDVEIVSCTFSENRVSPLCEGRSQMCASGGALTVTGQNGRTRVRSSEFVSNSADNEGGCIFSTGTSLLDVRGSRLSACTAKHGDGGGLSGRGDSLVVLSGSISIRHCEAKEGHGGGMSFAGALLSIGDKDGDRADVQLEENRAKNGGGMSFMALIELAQGSSTLIQRNTAAQFGGGAHGFSTFGRLVVDYDHSLVITRNAANSGAGIAVMRGAQVHVSMSECVGVGSTLAAAQCSVEMRENGKCDPSCMTKSCNWDNGDCNYLFLHAGNDASQPCPCSLPSYVISLIHTTCEPGAPPGEKAGFDQCFSAGCDWARYWEACHGFTRSIATCPLFDAVVHKSLISVPGLVYLKEGRGFTTPLKGGRREDDWGDPAVPFGFEQGTVGRCLNAQCKTSSPPLTDIAGLGLPRWEAGEAWCDSLADFDGFVWQSIMANQPCCMEEGYQDKFEDFA